MDFKAIETAAQRCVDAKAAYLANDDETLEAGLLKELEAADAELAAFGEPAFIILTLLHLISE